MRFSKLGVCDMTEQHRISVTLTDELKVQIDELKREKYYNSSYSELYRQAITAGIETIKYKKEKNKLSKKDV